MGYLKAWKESFAELISRANSRSPIKKHFWKSPVYKNSIKGGQPNSNTHSFALDFRASQPNSFLFMDSFRDESEYISVSS